MLNLSPDPSLTQPLSAVISMRQNSKAAHSIDYHRPRAKQLTFQADRSRPLGRSISESSLSEIGDWPRARSSLRDRNVAGVELPDIGKCVTMAPLTG